jgi:diguanylate cyclase (GGDEF)-like protein
MAAVHTVIPCASAVLYAVSRDEQSPLVAVAAWSRGERPVQPPPVEEFPERADLATGARLVGARCFVPAGYSSDGELMLVIDDIDVKKVSSYFAEEAASGLSSSLLLMTARLAYVSNLRHESRTDALTGLANRRALEERLELVTGQASRTGAPITVGMIDLDRFKAFNDRFGHQSGDELLRLLSEALSQRLRAQDLLARYGGEEFCVVLPDTDVLAARIVLEELRVLAPTIAIDGWAATISVGIAEWFPGESTGSLLERADRALYAAKEQGRDRVVTARQLRAAAA